MHVPTRVPRGARHVSLQGQLNAHTNASAMDVSSFQRLKQNPRRGSVYLCTGQYRSLRQFCRIPNASPIPAGLSSRPSLHPRVLGGAKTVLHDPKLQAWQGPEMMRSHTNLDCRRAARGLALLLTCWTEQAVRKKFEPFLAPSRSGPCSSPEPEPPTWFSEGSAPEVQDGFAAGHLAGLVSFYQLEAPYEAASSLPNVPSREAGFTGTLTRGERRVNHESPSSKNPMVS